jgi:hypothetical protein
MLHRLHRLSAVIIGSYVLLHLFNHLLALKGPALHIAFMKQYRQIYRLPVIEALLMFLLVYQIGSGIYFIVKRRGQRHGFFAKAQAWSGAYLAFFLLIHVGAVLYGRYALHLDTNFYYAAAGLNITPYQVFFMPYYFLAVVAFFTHVACALHWLSRKHITLPVRNLAGYATLFLGISIATLIVATFMGAFYHVTIPAAYRATFQ